jgi:hypothetical protein
VKDSGVVGGAGVRNVNVEAGMGSIADDGVRWAGYILLLLLVMVMEELLRVVEGVGEVYGQAKK